MLNFDFQFNNIPKKCMAKICVVVQTDRIKVYLCVCVVKFSGIETYNSRSRSSLSASLVNESVSV